MLVRAYFGIFLGQKMKRLFLHSSVIAYNNISMKRQFGLIWEIRLKRIYGLLRQRRQREKHAIRSLNARY
jgi:hypothetical protein